MDEVPILQRCVTLGRAFVSKGMDEHAALLREFYVSVQRARPCANTWSAELVDHWLAVLQLPPFEKQFEVREAGAKCATCEKDPTQITSRRTETNFPGGALMRCNDCGESWLERFAS